MKIITVIGTRPNFIKVTQFNKWLNDKTFGLENFIVHTGQHYDKEMAENFFNQFCLKPDFYLDLSHSDPASIIGEVIIKLTSLFKKIKPDLVLVVGDVNSTLAASIAANKSGIKIGHIESGLRSNDKTMPEEINRIITDSVSDIYFVTEPNGLENLLQEGVENSNIHYVGNTMIDTLLSYTKNIDESNILEKLGVYKQQYSLVTMHRPATVDNLNGLLRMIEVLEFLCSKSNVVFPIHPRTEIKLKYFNLNEKLKSVSNLKTLGPLDYFSFQKLIKNSNLVITDSGGIQEETTYYRIPCVTLRPNTERPSTIELGSNVLSDIFNVNLFEILDSHKHQNREKFSVPKYWDGLATKRIRDKIIALNI